MTISADLLQFLEDLSKNNNREWFEGRKSTFVELYKGYKQFHQQVGDLLKTNDQIEKGRVYRIYRDVRFSKDKTPYKGYLAFNFKRATHYLRGGYYFQLQPGASFLAGGFFGPNAQDLLHIRKQISQFPDALEQVLFDERFNSYFGQLEGERLKTSPKGFESDDPAIEWLRYKQFYVAHHFSDHEVLAPGFASVLANGFTRLRPFFDYMSEILTTDLNGESLLE